MGPETRYRAPRRTTGSASGYSGLQCPSRAFSTWRCSTFVCMSVSAAQRPALQGGGHGRALQAPLVPGSAGRALRAGVAPTSAGTWPSCCGPRSRCEGHKSTRSCRVQALASPTPSLRTELHSASSPVRAAVRLSDEIYVETRPRCRHDDFRVVVGGGGRGGSKWRRGRIAQIKYPGWCSTGSRGLEASDGPC